MPKLNPATQAARRAHILDAAELCFARSGFHRTSMQDICKEAGVSAGALYVYFASKEDLIAGIAERDRNKLAGELAALAEAPDLAAALAKLGEHYAVEEPQHKRLMCIEIGLEVDAQRGGRRDLPLGRPLRAARASSSCSSAPPPKAASARRSTPQDAGPHHRRDRRRHVLAPRHRSRFRSQERDPRHHRHRSRTAEPARARPSPRRATPRPSRRKGAHP